MARGAGDVVARGDQEAPETVALCVRNKDSFPCLGVIHGWSRSKSSEEADAASAPGIDSFNSPD